MFFSFPRLGFVFGRHAMPDNEIHQPHDKLFAVGFGDPATAAAFLRAQLPPELVVQIDWATLKPESGSFVDPEFRKTQSDLLFSASLVGRKCLLYVLFEHQSQEDPHMALRMLRYMVNIWWTFLRDHPGKSLPVICPVVLAQNAKAWKVKPDFASLLNIPEMLRSALRSYIPDFRFDLFQLAEHSFESLPGTAAGILILRVMKAERLAKLLDDWVWDEALISEIPLELFEILLRYILAADIDKPAVMNRLQSIQNSATRDKAMSVAQQLRQEGRQEGSAGLVLRLVQRKFPGIANEVALTLDRLDEEQLLSFGEAILFIQTPEECLEWLSNR